MASLLLLVLLNTAAGWREQSSSTTVALHGSWMLLNVLDLMGWNLDWNLGWTVAFRAYRALVSLVGFLRGRNSARDSPIDCSGWIDSAAMRMSCDSICCPSAFAGVSSWVGLSRRSSGSTIYREDTLIRVGYNSPGGTPEGIAHSRPSYLMAAVANRHKLYTYDHP